MLSSKQTGKAKSGLRGYSDMLPAVYGLNAAMNLSAL